MNRPLGVDIIIILAFFDAEIVGVTITHEAANLSIRKLASELNDGHLKGKMEEKVNNEPLEDPLTGISYTVQLIDTDEILEFGQQSIALTREQLLSQVLNLSDLRSKINRLQHHKGPLNEAKNNSSESGESDVNG